MSTNLIDEPSNLSFTEIYHQLQDSGELLLTIPAEQEALLRKGLASAKYKQLEKLRKAGIDPEDATLEFIQVSKDANAETIVMHVILAKKSTVKVFGIQLPDNTI